MDEDILVVQDLGKSFAREGEELVVLERLDFAVARHEFVSILGPSGAGKTTLLRCISGLEQPTSGEVALNGKRIETCPDDMAFVFQDYSQSLLPWMSVLDNVAFVLRNKGHGAAQMRERSEQALADVGLGGFESSYPWQLSGGMQQRVAIARALAYDADLLVMDEPFAAVDAQTRADLQDLLLEVHARLRPAILFVTHDVDEAVYLADRVAVLTHRPASVRDTFEVDLDKPRDQIATKAQPGYAEMRSRVLSLIKRDPQGAVADPA